MCSQPIEHDAQLSRATLRASARSSAARRGASEKVEAWKLRVGSVAIALKASRLASVPSSRYLAVAGPNERSRRSRAAASTALGSAGATFVDEQHGRLVAGAAHDDRVVARQLAGDREVAGGQRVVEHPRQRRLGDDG